MLLYQFSDLLKCCSFGGLRSPPCSTGVNRWRFEVQGRVAAWTHSCNVLSVFLLDVLLFRQSSIPGRSSVYGKIGFSKANRPTKWAENLLIPVSSVVVAAAVRVRNSDSIVTVSNNILRAFNCFQFSLLLTVLISIESWVSQWWNVGSGFSAFAVVADCIQLQLNRSFQTI